MSPRIAELAARLKAMGVAPANAAKHKLVGLLGRRLRGGADAGEVMVAGAVAGTPRGARRFAPPHPPAA